MVDCLFGQQHAHIDDRTRQCVPTAIVTIRQRPVVLYSGHQRAAEAPGQSADRAPSQAARAQDCRELGSAPRRQRPGTLTSGFGDPTAPTGSPNTRASALSSSRCRLVRTGFGPSGCVFGRGLGGLRRPPRRATFPPLARPPPAGARSVADGHRRDLPYARRDLQRHDAACGDRPRRGLRVPAPPPDAPALEPDQRHRHRFLEATRDALESRSLHPVVPGEASDPALSFARESWRPP